MQTNELIALNSDSTIVAKFAKHADKERFYESEADLEAQFIELLENQGYEYAREIKDEAALLANLKAQIERLNKCEFSQNEWQNLLSNVFLKANDSIKDKTELIQQRHIIDFTFDSGKSQNIYLIDKFHLANNHLQVINQYIAHGVYENRYDVSVLVNGYSVIKFCYNDCIIYMKGLNCDVTK